MIYLSKEAYEEGLYSDKSDVFSLGIVFNQVLTPSGRHLYYDKDQPFESDAIHDIRENIKKGNRFFKELN